jgi:hypothetical protein
MMGSVTLRSFSLLKWTALERQSAPGAADFLDARGVVFFELGRIFCRLNAYREAQRVTRIVVILLGWPMVRLASRSRWSKWSSAARR